LIGNCDQRRLGIPGRRFGLQTLTAHGLGAILVDVDHPGIKLAGCATLREKKRCAAVAIIFDVSPPPDTTSANELTSFRIQLRHLASRIFRLGANPFVF